MSTYTKTKSSRYSASETTTGILLLALTLMLVQLFCAGTASAGSDERYERYRREVKMYGVIDSMPSSDLTGRWIVGGRDVEVTDRTRIKEKHGRAEAGRPVEIEGYRDNNRFIADEIEVERSRKHRGLYWKHRGSY